MAKITDLWDLVTIKLSQKIVIQKVIWAIQKTLRHRKQNKIFFKSFHFEWCLFISEIFLTSSDSSAELVIILLFQLGQCFCPLPEWLPSIQHPRLLSESCLLVNKSVLLLQTDYKKRKKNKNKLRCSFDKHTIVILLNILL